MKNTYFFIPGYHRLVYCHDILHESDELVLGGLAQYLSDSKTNISRQAIKMEDFKKLRPVEVNHDSPWLHSFMVKNSWDSWCVTEVSQRTGSILKGAIALPNAPRNYYNPGFIKY